MRMEDFSIPSFGRVESKLPDGTKYVIPCAVSESLIEQSVDYENTGKVITQYDVAEWIDHAFQEPCKCCVFQNEEVCDYSRCLNGIVDWLEMNMD